MVRNWDFYGGTTQKKTALFVFDLVSPFTLQRCEWAVRPKVTDKPIDQVILYTAYSMTGSIGLSVFL